MIKKFLNSYLWISPFIGAGVYYLFYSKNPYLILYPKDWIGIIAISLFIPVWIGSNRLMIPKEETALTGKEKASHPKVADELLYKGPTGIVFGQDKHTKRYVCKDLSRDGHIFILGGSGSGKSSCIIIPTLLCNPDATIFALDIKGELHQKGIEHNSRHSLVFDPNDRDSYGYDPLYRLHTPKTPTSQEVLDTFQLIAYSLIQLPVGTHDPFWKLSSRNLLLGLMLYFYDLGLKDFISIIDGILSEQISEIIDDAIDKGDVNSGYYRYLITFKGMSDVTLGGIQAEMNNHIQVFANDMDIRFAFKDNEKKLNPRFLEDGFSMYIAIQEHKLSAYYDVLQLIINQTLSELEKRPEDSNPILFCIDELPRILSAGKIDRLLDAVKTLRSRKVTLCLISQSEEALQSAYSVEETADIIANCSYIVVLDAKSPKTINSVVAWGGKYCERKQSWNQSTALTESVGVSFDEKDIINSADLMSLVQTGEAILISPYGYSRIKKTPYFKDKLLKQKSNKVQASYQKINIQKEDFIYEIED